MGIICIAMLWTWTDNGSEMICAHSHYTHNAYLFRFFITLFRFCESMLCKCAQIITLKKMKGEIGLIGYHCWGKQKMVIFFLLKK